MWFCLETSKETRLRVHWCDIIRFCFNLADLMKIFNNSRNVKHDKRELKNCSQVFCKFIVLKLLKNTDKNQMLFNIIITISISFRE